MSIIFLLIIGAAAGYVATRVMDLDTSVPVTVGIGVLGALVGGFILTALLTILGIAAGLIGAVIGALVLIWAYQRVFGNRN